jgi:hypothetical protein
VALGDVTSDFGSDLLMERNRLFSDDLDNHHGDRQSITIVATTEADPRFRSVPIDPEQLVIREARRRQRRRRLFIGVTMVALAVAALILGLTFRTSGQAPGTKSIRVGTSEVPLSRLVPSLVERTVAARTAAFTFGMRGSAISVRGSGTVNFVAPSYAINETISGGPLFTGSTKLTRTPSGQFYEQAPGAVPTEESGDGLLPLQAVSATTNGTIAILARSPAGYAFGLLSLLPSSDLRLVAVGTGEVARVPATTYLFGDSGQCRGRVQTEVWTTEQGRILQLATTQLSSRGKWIETMSLTLTHFGLPVTVAAPRSAAPIAANNRPTSHGGSVGSSGSFSAVPICSP